MLARLIFEDNLMLRDPSRLWISSLSVLILLCSVACAAEVDSAEPQTRSQATAAPRPAAVAPAEFGKRFALGAFPNLNAGSGAPAQFDLDQLLGQRAVVLYYWIAGNPRADSVFAELQSLTQDLGTEKVALVGVVYRRNEEEGAAISQRIQALGIRVPVLHDEGFKLGQSLRVQSVPNITILDGQGNLRLTNGASLIQDLEYKMTVETAIRRVAETGTLGSYGYLARYYPVTELVGKPCPDFKAPLLSNSVEQRWSTMIKSDKVNVLIFWSVDCPHCRKSLPEINEWLQQNRSGFNVVTAAKVTDTTNKIKTKEFCDLNNFVFPTLVDQDLQIASLYQVTSTPTIVVIRPDGVVDSVILDSSGDFGEKMAEKKKALL